MTLRQLLEALGMPVWMLDHPNLEKVLITTSNEKIVGADQDDENIYLEV